MTTTTEAGIEVSSPSGDRRWEANFYEVGTDGLLTALLVFVTLLFFAAGAPTRSAALLHGVILIAWALVLMLMRWTPTRRLAPFLRPLTAVAITLALYSTIWKPAFIMMGGSRDAALSRLEQFLFGTPEPVFRVAALASPLVVELFSFIYGWFIPLLYISIFLGCFGRRRDEVAEFLFGFVLTYSIAYLGYLFVPAYGPVLYHDFGAPLPGGFFHGLVVSGIESLGGPHGAFPSLHVGATAYLCLYDLRRNRLRGLTLVPIVLGIAFATILLRYHYVVDVVVGLSIAFVASRLATMRQMDADRAYPPIRPAGQGGILRLLLAPALGTFFRKIEVDGREHVPLDGPVLFVSNHLNGLIDPLLVISALGRPVRLTAKSTLRENPLLELMFRFFRIIPIHRRQDLQGDDDPSRNEEAFDACVAELADGRAILIFPEGMSHSEPKMKPLRTGAARIAARFQQIEGRPLTVVPVALHFEAKEHYRSAVLVQFGAPVVASETDPKALTAVIEQRLREETLNFEGRREQILFGSAARLLEATAAPPPPVDRESRLKSRVDLTRSLLRLYEPAREAHPARVTALVGRLRSMHRELRRSDLAPEELFLPASTWRVAYFLVREMELVIFGLLPASLGLLQHGIPWLVTRGITRRFSRDRDHWASFAILSGLLVFPTFWIVEIGTVAIAWSPVAAVVYALLLPFTFPYAVLWTARAASAGRRASAFVRLRLGRASRERLRRESEEIAGEIRELARIATHRVNEETR